MNYRVLVQMNPVARFLRRLLSLRRTLHDPYERYCDECWKRDIEPLSFEEHRKHGGRTTPAYFHHEEYRPPAYLEYCQRCARSGVDPMSYSEYLTAGGRAKGYCLVCGYNLRGNRSGICPECGSAFANPHFDLERERARLKSATICPPCGESL